MTPPQIAGWRFLCGIGVGLVLGAWYGFLRPLGRHHRHAADLLFVAFLLPAWVYFSFGICKGDLRPGYLPSLLLGGWLFDRTVGRLFSPVWAGFWNLIGWFYGKIKKIFRKIKFFVKKIFTYPRKFVTMILYSHFYAKKHAGGRKHERSRKRKRQICSQTQQ